MVQSLQTLFGQSIDFAGTFWPGSLSLEDCLKKFDTHQAGAESWLVNRLVVAVRDLPELAQRVESRRTVLPIAVVTPPATDDATWQDGLETAARNMNEVASRNLEIESLEVSLPATGDLATLLRDLRGFQDADVFVEIPPERDLIETLAALADTEWLRAKLRTGGPEAHHLPDPERVSEFILSVIDLEMEAKLTAGLHHALPARNSDGTLARFGFLTTFAGAAIARSHDLSRREFAQLLTNTDPGAWSFEAKSITYLGQKVDILDLQEARESLLSFGSCSIDEPFSDLQRLSP